MELRLTEKQYRRLLDLVYIGNWVLNSTGGRTVSGTMTRWRAWCFPTAWTTVWRR